MKGFVQTVQRVGRYSYRKVMAHVTNPDHYEPTQSTSDAPPLKIDPRYDRRNTPIAE
jgi:hypothetical protein